MDITNNAEIPQKSTRLIKEEKLKNKEISNKRILVENLIENVKRFRMLSEKYRSQKKIWIKISFNF